MSYPREPTQAPPERSPVKVPVSGVSGRLAALIVVGVAAVLVGVAVLGRGGDQAPGAHAAREGPTATATSLGSTHAATPRSTPARSPSPVEAATNAAREQGRAFDFASQDLCAWFSPGEITEIVADAYRERGGASAPGAFTRWSATSGCQGWIADDHRGVVQLYVGPDSSIAPLPLHVEDFASLRPMDTEVRVGTVSEGQVRNIAGTSAHLAVAGHREVLAFVHLAPEAYAREPVAWRNGVALAIAGEMLRRMRWVVRALPTGGTPLPDIAGALPGDDGTGPLPLGSITDVPNPDRLDFLFELCSADCIRDAHWIDARRPWLGSGVWTAGRPFHVREGFINNGTEPLGEGFDVVLYVTRLEGGATEPTYRYTSDYVLRGTADRCGPTYRAQVGPETCEWFVHDFPRGLPEGRWAIWAMWEAPCRAWVDLGLTDACRDPDEVISLFSSGFDAPYSTAAPSYTEERP